MNLNRFNLVVVGAGALGCAVLKNLVSYGFGSIRIIDGDIVTKENLGAQTIYEENDANLLKYKTDAAITHLALLNPKIRLVGLPFYIGEQRAEEMLDGADMVLDFTDNLDTRLIINDACSKKGVPLLIASIKKDKGFFYIIDWKNACFNCIYRNSKDIDTKSCGGVSVENAKLLGDMISKEIVKFLRDKKDICLFNSVSIKEEKVSGVIMKRNEDCETCGKHSYKHKLDTGFIQVCGNAIKFSLQRKIDLKKVRTFLPGAVLVDKEDALLYRKGDKTVFISGFGDFLFGGFDREGAQKFISNVSIFRA